MEDGYGLKMSGIPFGDTRFVAYHLEEKLGKAVSETEKIKRLLHTSPMALATQLIFCEQGLFQFEMQLLDPSIIVPYLERFDAILTETLNTVLGTKFQELPLLVQRRIRQPRRLAGFGVRSMADVARMAWIGGCMLTLPSMMDSKDRNGNKIRGLFNHLSCVGSFNGGEEAKRFEHFIEKNTQQAQTNICPRLGRTQK
jgi:hypothetical protein